jgi:hypothetical protein
MQSQPATQASFDYYTINYNSEDPAHIWHAVQPCGSALAEQWTSARWIDHRASLPAGGSGSVLVQSVTRSEHVGAPAEVVLGGLVTPNSNVGNSHGANILNNDEFVSAKLASSTALQLDQGFLNAIGDGSLSVCYDLPINANAARSKSSGDTLLAAVQQQTALPDNVKSAGPSCCLGGALSVSKHADDGCSVSGALSVSNYISYNELRSKSKQASSGCPSPFLPAAVQQQTVLHEDAISAGPSGCLGAVQLEQGFQNTIGNSSLSACSDLPKNANAARSNSPVDALLAAVQQQTALPDDVKSAGPSCCLGGALSVSKHEEGCVSVSSALSVSNQDSNVVLVPTNKQASSGCPFPAAVRQQSALHKDVKPAGPSCCLGGALSGSNHDDNGRSVSGDPAVSNHNCYNEPMSKSKQASSGCSSPVFPAAVQQQTAVHKDAKSAGPSGCLGGRPLRGCVCILGY